MADDRHNNDGKEEGSEKKKVVIQDGGDDDAVRSDEKNESLSVSGGVESNFAGMKKKKKKKPSLEAGGQEFDEHAGDRDYEYGELLNRAYNFVEGKNPELAGNRRGTDIPDPEVLREGIQKTVFVNFMDICNVLHLSPDSVMEFLLADLGRSGSLDEQQRLVVKGRFKSRDFAGALRRYVIKYPDSDRVPDMDTDTNHKKLSVCSSAKSDIEAEAGEDLDGELRSRLEAIKLRYLEELKGTLMKRDNDIENAWKEWISTNTVPVKAGFVAHVG